MIWKLTKSTRDGQPGMQHRAGVVCLLDMNERWYWMHPWNEQFMFLLVNSLILHSLEVCLSKCTPGFSPRPSLVAIRICWINVNPQLFPHLLVNFAIKAYDIWQRMTKHFVTMLLQVQLWILQKVLQLLLTATTVPSDVGRAYCTNSLGQFNEFNFMLHHVFQIFSKGRIVPSDLFGAFAKLSRPSGGVLPPSCEHLQKASARVLRDTFRNLTMFVRYEPCISLLSSWTVGKMWEMTGDVNCDQG